MYESRSIKLQKMEIKYKTCVSIPLLDIAFFKLRLQVGYLHQQICKQSQFMHYSTLDTWRWWRERPSVHMRSTHLSSCTPQSAEESHGIPRSGSTVTWWHQNNMLTLIEDNKTFSEYCRGDALTSALCVKYGANLRRNFYSVCIAPVFICSVVIQERPTMFLNAKGALKVHFVILGEIFFSAKTNW